MSAKQRGLGRGLGALIGDFPEEPESGAVTKLPLQKVEPNPDQPRRTFDEEELQALAEAVLLHDEVRYCPHGRPVCIELTKKEIERRFGRLG